MASASDDATVTTPAPVKKCARTPGFWSNHNGQFALLWQGEPHDLTTDLMPIVLGDGPGKSVTVNSDVVANAIFESTPTADSSKSNGISMLYIALLAAKFDTANGAIAPRHVLDAMERSDQILTGYDESDWKDIEKTDKALAEEIESLKDTLVAFINGQYDGDNCVGDWWKDGEEAPA